MPDRTTVLNGQAGETLLDSYEVERRPIGLAVSALSASMNDARGLMAIGRWLHRVARRGSCAR